jgi:hypothetical protein
MLSGKSFSIGTGPLQQINSAATCQPAVLTLRSRNPVFQNALRNEGLTLQDVIHRKLLPGHPLDNFTQESLARKYWNDVKRQLDAVAITHLLPVKD